MGIFRDPLEKKHADPWGAMVIPGDPWGRANIQNCGMAKHCLLQQLYQAFAAPPSLVHMSDFELHIMSETSCAQFDEIVRRRMDNRRRSVEEHLPTTWLQRRRYLPVVSLAPRVSQTFRQDAHHPEGPSSPITILRTTLQPTLETSNGAYPSVAESQPLKQNLPKL